MRQTAAALDAVGESLVAIYAAKTRKPRDEVRKLMEAETLVHR